MNQRFLGYYNQESGQFYFTKVSALSPQDHRYFSDGHTDRFFIWGENNRLEVAQGIQLGKDCLGVFSEGRIYIPSINAMVSFFDDDCIEWAESTPVTDEEKELFFQFEVKAKGSEVKITNLKEKV